MTVRIQRTGVKPLPRKPSSRKTIPSQSTKPKANPSETQLKRQAFRNLLVNYFPFWVVLSLILIPLLPDLLHGAVKVSLRALGAAPGIAMDAGGKVLDAGGDVIEWTAGGIVDVVEWAVPGMVNAGRDVIEWTVGGIVDVGSAAADAVSAILRGGDQTAGHRSASGSGLLAPLFTAQIDQWDEEIVRWAQEYDLDPNLLATVMQIESCGHPTVSSPAGAQGLFQVMPFHFDAGEDMLDPDTNARRGAAFLNLCLDLANGDTGLAMACYNGGPSVLETNFDAWHPEPQRYYYWGTGIYADAQQNRSSSARLDEWLDAGGINLCNRASSALGLN